MKGSDYKSRAKIGERADHKIVVVHASGKLTREDYELFLPEAERLIKEDGKIRLLFEMRDFHGWDTGALWEDIKFDFKQFADIERLAMVGEKKWEEWMAKFCHHLPKLKFTTLIKNQPEKLLTGLRAIDQRSF